MKNILLIFLISSVASFGQTGAKPDYSDKGEIESIECSCQQGKFNKKTNSLKAAYYLGISCNDGSAQEFNNEGRLIRTEYKFESEFMNGTPTGYTKMISIMHYENDVLIRTESIQVSDQNDTLNHQITYHHLNSDDVEIDSTFSSKLIFLSSSITIRDTINHFSYSEFSNTDGSFSTKDSAIYDQYNRLLRLYSKTSGESDYLNEEFIFVIEHDEQNYSSYSIRNGKKSTTSYYEVNDSGLVTSYKYNQAMSGRPVDYVQLTYQYVYDSKGNWIERWIYKDDVLSAIENRKIIYRD